MSVSLSAQTSPSEAMKSFLNTKIRDKSVKEALCKWNDQAAVTDSDVLQLKKLTLNLIPQLGIPALRDLSGIKVSDLEMRGSPHCTDKPSSFGIGVRETFSIRAEISNNNGQENYIIAINNISKSPEVIALYNKVAPLVQKGLALNVMDNVAKSINQTIVPLSQRPLSIKHELINGVGSLNINFSEIANSGELYSLSLKEDGTLMAFNQLNVDLNNHATTTGEASVNYQIIAAARCVCNASLIVKGENGQTGHILDSQKVSSITVQVQNKEITLQNPPAGIRDYYDGVENDVWVKSELTKKGIKLAENDLVVLMSFKGAITLYTDHTGVTPISQ